MITEQKGYTIKIINRHQISDKRMGGWSKNTKIVNTINWR
jgi:hypothetical protein